MSSQFNPVFDNINSIPLVNTGIDIGTNVSNGNTASNENRTSNGNTASIGNILSQNSNNMTCFNEDTKILTDNGYIPIQKLRKGSLVKTLKDGYKAINMIGKREIYHPSIKERIKDQLYKCSNSKYTEIFEDLIITGCHSILVDNFKNEEEKNNNKNMTILRSYFFTLLQQSHI